MTLSIICALTTNHAIGNKGGLLYYLPADLKHFKISLQDTPLLWGAKHLSRCPRGLYPTDAM